jgi:hypothetical protein
MWALILVLGEMRRRSASLAGVGCPGHGHDGEGVEMMFGYKLLGWDGREGVFL